MEFEEKYELNLWLCNYFLSTRKEGWFDRIGLVEFWIYDTTEMGYESEV